MLHLSLRSTALALTLVAAPLMAQEPVAPAGPLTDAEVQSAIEQGKAKPDVTIGVGLGASANGYHGSRCRSGNSRKSGCAFAVILQGASGRISGLAGAAAKKYLPFTADSVTPEMRAPVLSVMVTPQTPAFDGRNWNHAPPARHVVVQARQKKGEPAADAIHPLQATPFPVEWTNAMGARFEGQGIVATFDMATLPAGDFDFVIVTGGEEVRYPMSAKDWEKHRATLR